MDIGNLLYALINSPGVGGAIVILVFTGALAIYYFLTRWILYGGKGKKS
jgi:hypothetical protein